MEVEECGVVSLRHFLSLAVYYVDRENCRGEKNGFMVAVSYIFLHFYNWKYKDASVKSNQNYGIAVKVVNHIKDITENTCNDENCDD